MDTGRRGVIAVGELVRVTFLDPRFEFVAGDLEEPGVFEVVGWVQPHRFDGWRSVASEIGPEVRAVTHIPEACIVSEERLQVAGLITLEQVS
jgi:hypothetical protein